MLSDGFRYDDERLDRDLSGLDHQGTMDAMRRLATEMTTYGKQAFLHRLAAVAFADGAISEPERHVLVDIGIALSMPAMHINDVITVADLAARLRQSAETGIRPGSPSGVRRRTRPSRSYASRADAAAALHHAAFATSPRCSA